MTTSDDRAIALLRSLLQVCRESDAGYATAERDIADTALRHELQRYRQERAKLARELEHRLQQLRGSVELAPSATAALHRAWIDTRAGGAENPTEAVLREVERGEDLAAGAYRQALKEHDLDSATYQLIERQYERVQAAHDRIRQLRDRAPSARTR